MKMKSTKHKVRREGSSHKDQRDHDQRDHRDLVSRMRLKWHRDQQADAVDFLAKHSAVRKNRPLAIELAYEEYCIRRDAGESISRSTFCNRFPTISRSLSRQIEVDEYVRQHPTMVSEQNELPWPSPGDTLLQFVVVEEIGRGAFARAYMCGQPEIGNRQVVVKVSRGGAVEANTMGGLDHPNIMSVFSVEEDPITQLTGICMPFVGRSTLFDVVDVAFGREAVPSRAGVILEASRALTSRGDSYQRTTPHVKIRSRSAYVTGVLQVALQLAEALVHAHDRGVLHGDLKPSNVVMSVTGIPMLVDFNLSQSRDSASFVTGGTLPYMAPEQIRLLLLGPDAEDLVDHRADVFSLGAIMYELLVGRTPFLIDGDETEPFAMAGRMLDAQTLALKSIRKLNPNVDARFATLVRQCLAFEVDQRPESMQQVVDELRRCLSVPHRARRFSRYHRRQFLIGGGLAAGMGFAAIGGLMLRSSPAQRAFEAGVVAYHEGDYLTATRRFNEAIAADPEFANPYLARGCTALRQFEVDQFEPRLDAAHRDLTLAGRYSESPEIDSVRAYCSIRRSDFLPATISLQQLIESGYENVAVYNNLGYCYEKSRVDVLLDPARAKERIVQADRAFRRAIELGPEAIAPRCNLAFLELMRYRSSGGGYVPTDGLLHVRKAIELGSDSAETFFFASKLVAVFAQSDKDTKLRAECLHYLDRATDEGYVLKSVKSFEFLEDEPKFQQILSKDSPNKHPSSVSLIIAPDIMDSRFGLDNDTDLIETL